MYGERLNHSCERRGIPSVLTFPLLFFGAAYHRRLRLTLPPRGYNLFYLLVSDQGSEDKTAEFESGIALVTTVELGPC